jgi:hypothetical protein
MNTIHANRERFGDLEDVLALAVAIVPVTLVSVAVR